MKTFRKAKLSSEDSYALYDYLRNIGISLDTLSLIQSFSKRLNFEIIQNLQKKFTVLIESHDECINDIWSVLNALSKYLPNFNRLILRIPLYQIPEDLIEFKSLRSLFIYSPNSHIIFPFSFFQHFPSLIDLTLSIGNLSLQDKCNNINNLRELTIHNCPNLSFIPSDIFQNQNLKTLNITNCQNIRNINFRPPSSSKLINLNLKNLPLLDRLPPSLFSIPSIESLHLTNLGIYIIPDLLQCINLKSLFIKNCPKLLYLPQSLKYIKNISQVRVEECHSLLKIPDEISKRQFDFFEIRECVRLIAPIILDPSVKSSYKISYENLGPLWELPPNDGFIRPEYENFSDYIGNFFTDDFEVSTLRNITPILELLFRLTPYRINIEDYGHNYYLELFFEVYLFNLLRIEDDLSIELRNGLYEYLSIKNQNIDDLRILL